jgi:hypothetical protein
MVVVKCECRFVLDRWRAVEKGGIGPPPLPRFVMLYTLPLHAANHGSSLFNPGQARRRRGHAQIQPM